MKRLIASLAALFAMLIPQSAPAATYLTLTSSSATACTSIATTAQAVYSVVNAAAAAQTVTLSIYDEAGSPTCASADLLFSVVLGASQVVNFPVLLYGQNWVQHGLAYKLSGSATNNIVVIYQ